MNENNLYNLKNVKILDLGCGPGNRAISFAKNGNKVVAVDSDGAAIESLSSRIGNLSIIVVNQDIREFEIEPDSYDCIIASNVLPFIKKDEIISVLEKVRRGLKKAGIAEFSLFGVDDPWAKMYADSMSFYERNEVQLFVEGLDSFSIEEMKGEAPMMNGELKYWHKFLIVYRNVLS